MTRDAESTTTAGLKRPKAILFDLGGTILEFETYFNESTGNDASHRILELATENPNEITAVELSRLTAEVASEFEAKRKLGNIEHPANLIDLHVYEPNGIRFDMSTEELSEIVFRETHRGARLEPGAEDVFKHMKEERIPMGIVSNSGFTARAVFTHVREFGLDRYFEFMMSTADYAFRKPDPRILLTACRRIGFRPADVWYVGNSIEHDIAGARNAGMPAIWYNAVNSDLCAPTPDAAISSWSDFTRLL